MASSRRTRTEEDFLTPTLVGAEGGRLRKGAGLVGNEGAGFFLIALGAGSLFSAFATVYGVCAGSAGGVVEYGRLGASVEPHGGMLGGGGDGGRALTELQGETQMIDRPGLRVEGWHWRGGRE